MTLLIGALTIGLILSLLALGVFISFRIFEFPDITADGSITLGAAVAAVLLVHGVHPVARDRWRRLLPARIAGAADRRHPHAVQDQRAAVRHPGDDRALLDQPARHGQEQRAAASRRDAGHAWPSTRRRVAARLDRDLTSRAGTSRCATPRCWSLALVASRRRRACCSTCSSAPTSARRCRRPATTRR